MATFKCPDCGSKVSTSADKCPKCGRPVTEEDRKPKTKKMTLKQYLLYLLIVIILLTVWQTRSAVKDKEHADEIARLRSTYTTVKPDKEKLKAKIDAYISNTLMPEIRRGCQKTGLPAPKSYRVIWENIQLDNYKLWIIFEGGSPAPNRTEQLARMVVGKISSILKDDLKIPNAQFVCEDTYISTYFASDVLGNTLINGGVQWHIGKEGDLPFWVSPENAKKYNNL